jgi:hypothetical protein
METSDQCAVAADGSLLDASAIIFYNEPDDDTPLPNPTNSESATSSIQVHPFFQDGSAPSKVVAGSRRSVRIIHPSARITDPNNLEGLGSAVTYKRSGTVTASAEGSRRAACRAKLTDSNNESEHDNKMDDIGTSVTTEEEGGRDSTDVELVEDVYQTTKAMGDADRQVRLKFLVQAHSKYVQ